MADMNEDWKSTFVRWLTIVLVVVVVAGGLVLAWPTYNRNCELRRLNADLEHQIEARRGEIAAFRESQRRFKTDPEFVEQIARQNHRVFPGEYIFMFRDKGGPANGKR